MSGRLRVLDRQRPVAGRGGVVVAVVSGLVAAVALAAFGGALAARAPLEVYGTALGVGLLAAAVAVRQLLALTYPLVDVAEPRESGKGSDEPLADVGPLPRRTLLRNALTAAAGALGLSLLVPVSTLGPRRRGVEQDTVWAQGVRLTDTDGQPLRSDDVPTGGLATVWPAVAARDDTDAVVLVRLSGVDASPPTNLDWVVDGQLIAYSKVCTHLGCPVGLFQEGEGTLFCPCHQQSFDATHGARPTFGPAARPLAQLPLGVDDEGYLIALGDFTQPVGPPVG